MADFENQTEQQPQDPPSPLDGSDHVAQDGSAAKTAAETASDDILETGFLPDGAGDNSPAGDDSLPDADGASPPSNGDDSDGCDDSDNQLALSASPTVGGGAAAPSPEERNENAPAAEAELRKRVNFLYEPGDLAHDVAKVLKILLAGDLPLYVHAEQLVVVVNPSSESRPEMHKIKHLTASQFAMFLSIVIEFVCEKNQKTVPIDAPTSLLRGVLEFPNLPFPHLRRIVGIPTLLPDGTLVDQAGYHEPSGIFYSPAPDVTFPEWDEMPTREDAILAVKVLTDLLCDALFADAEVDLAAAMAAIITPIVRTAIDGCVPAFVFEAATPRIGKSELVNFTSLILTGKTAKVQAPRSDMEMEKRITGHVRAGDAMITFDNGVKPIGGPAIEAAVTSRTWTGRILCSNKMYTGPMETTVYFTGNHVTYHIDMLDRVVPIHLTTELENASERPLKRPNAQQWILANRGQLIAAAVTICRAYMLAGSPDMNLKPMRGFDAWSRVVRSALVWSGTADPLHRRAELKADRDPETAAFGMVLTGLERLFPEARAFTAKAVFDKLHGSAQSAAGREQTDTLNAAFGVLFDAAPAKLGQLKFSYALKRLTERTVGGLHMRRTRNGNAGNEYKVVRIAAEEPTDVASTQ